MTSTNQAQQEAWNGDSGQRWAADADRRDRVLQPIADVLLDAAQLRSGESVLDVGCGCGVTTLAAARAVAPGSALGIDLSEPMLALARTRADDVVNVDFITADAQTHTFDTPAFDVVISRFGTMFFDDPIGAFANIGSATNPRGRLCIATWQSLTANDWLMIPGVALLQYGTLPEASDNEPGMFAQSNTDVIHKTLQAAGWTDINIDPVTLELRLGRDAAEATEYLSETGVARRVIETIDEASRAPAIAEVEQLLAGYASADGVRLNAGVFIVSAVR